MNLIRRSIVLALLLCCTVPGSSAAPVVTNAPVKLQPQRWLLIVDTSAAMKRRAEALEGVLGELLLSGMSGQMQAGDELGIWTYNKKLIAGVAPMQSWDPAHSNLISGRSARFIGQQEFKDKARLESVMATLPQVVKESRRLTVLIFSDGTQQISGTPFDDAINAAYAEHKDALKKSRMPLVTVLRSDRGKYIGQNVSFAPWPVEFPTFPEEPKPLTPVAVPIKPTPPMKSIIIGGGPKTNAPVNELVLPPPVVPAPVPVVKPVEPEPVTNPAPTTVEVEVPMPTIPEVPVVATPPVVTNPPAVSPAQPVAPAPPSATAETVSARKWPLILGIGCMWLAIVAALLLARRSRRANATSLITRSFDRNQK